MFLIPRESQTFKDQAIDKKADMKRRMKEFKKREEMILKQEQRMMPVYKKEKKTKVLI